VGNRRGRSKAFVGFFKHLSGVVDVEGLLLQRAGVPFASRRGEEIAAVDVDRRCDLVERISYRMDNRFTERDGLFEAKRLYSMWNETAFAPVIERIVLAPAINSDDGPHSMVMRVQSHARPPQDVQNRQCLG